MSKMNETELRRRLDLLSHIEPSPETTRRALDRVRRTLGQTDKQPDARHASWWRILMRSKLSKLAVAAAVLAAIAVLWQSVRLTGNAYALVDVPHLLGQARTIHVRMHRFNGEDRYSSEYWYDLASGRMYRYWEQLATEEGPEGPQTVTNINQTVWDGQYVMEVNHRTRTVGFQKLLASQQRPNQLLIADLGQRMAVQDTRNLAEYTRIGTEEIGGHSYDIWRREFTSAPAMRIRWRLDYWVSPTTGGIGRVRQWLKIDQDWILSSETDAIEIDMEPPAGTFSTEPPAGYTLKNGKDAAEVAGIGLNTYEAPDGCSLRAPLSFAMDDGSILVCWRVTYGTTLSDPNGPYGQLSFGGELAQTPMKAFGLTSHTGWNHTGPGLHYVGRHVAVTRKAGRTYEWALYVPPRKVAAVERVVYALTAIEFDAEKSATLRTEHKLLLRTGHKLLLTLASLCITREDFTRYVPAAVRELSDDEVVPAEITCERLQVMAEQVRATPQLYEAVRTWAEGPQSRMLKAEPVETTTPEQVRRQARQLVEAFFAAVVEGRDADAMKMLRYEEPRASRVVTGMRQLPGVNDIKVESIYATEENALVLTNEFPAYEGRSGRWAIAVAKEKGTWRIGDFDATTTEQMQEEIDDYLEHFPNAKHFPER